MIFLQLIDGSPHFVATEWLFSGEQTIALYKKLYANIRCTVCEQLLAPATEEILQDLRSSLYGEHQGHGNVGVLD